MPGRGCSTFTTISRKRSRAPSVAKRDADLGSIERALQARGWRRCGGRSGRGYARAGKPSTRSRRTRRESCRRRSWNADERDRAGRCRAGRRTRRARRRVVRSRMRTIAACAANVGASPSRRASPRKIEPDQRLCRPHRADRRRSPAACGFRSTCATANESRPSRWTSAASGTRFRSQRAADAAAERAVLVLVPWKLPAQLVLVHVPAFDSGDPHAEDVNVVGREPRQRMVCLFSRQLSDRELELYGAVSRVGTADAVRAHDRRQRIAERTPPRRRAGRTAIYKNITSRSSESSPFRPATTKLHERPGAPLAVERNRSAAIDARSPRRNAHVAPATRAAAASAPPETEPGVETPGRPRGTLRAAVRQGGSRRPLVESDRPKEPRARPIQRFSPQHSSPSATGLRPSDAWPSRMAASPPFFPPTDRGTVAVPRARPSRPV